MRWIGLGVTALATSVSVVASCNFLVGVQDYCFENCPKEDGGPPDGGGPDAMDADAGDGEAGIGPGSVLWAMGYGNGGDQTVNAIAVSPLGHLFITGKGSGYDFGCPLDTSDGGDGGTGGTRDGYLVELGTDGACVWGYFFGDGAEGVGLAVNQGELTLAGTFTKQLELPGRGTYPITVPDSVKASFVMRFDVTHNVEWVTALYSPSGATATATSVASTLNRVAVAVNYTNDLKGASVDPTNPTPIGAGALGPDAYVVVLDATKGVPDISKSILVNNTKTSAQTLNSVQMPADDSVAFTGWTVSGASINGLGISGPSTQSVLVASLVGNTSPVEGIVTGNDTQGGNVLALDGTGGVFVAGDFQGQLGDPGATNTLVDTGDQHVFLAHMLGAGTNFTIDRAIQLGSPDSMGAASVRGMAMDQEGLVLVGTFSHALAFDAQPKVGANGANDVFVAKVDTQLKTPLWLRGFGASNQDQGADAVALSNDGSTFYVAGHYSGGITLDGTKLTGHGGKDVFIAKIMP